MGNEEWEQECICGDKVAPYGISSEPQPDGDDLKTRHYECKNCGEMWYCEGRYRNGELHSAWECEEGET